MSMRRNGIRVRIYQVPGTRYTIRSHRTLGYLGAVFTISVQYGLPRIVSREEQES